MYSLGTLDLLSLVVFFECNPLKGIRLFSKRPQLSPQDSHDFKGFLWEWYGSSMMLQLGSLCGDLINLRGAKCSDDMSENGS